MSTELILLIAFAAEYSGYGPSKQWFMSLMRRYGVFAEATFFKNIQPNYYFYGTWFCIVLFPAILVAILVKQVSDHSALLSYIIQIAILYQFLGYSRFFDRCKETKTVWVQKTVGIDEHTTVITTLEIETKTKPETAHFFAHQDSSDYDVIVRMLCSFYRDVFSPMVWFIFLGLAGVVFYRLSLITSDLWDRDGRIGRIHDWIDWLPVRLAVLCFAVCGHFRSVVDHVFDDFCSFSLHKNEQLLTTASLSSMSFSEVVIEDTSQSLFTDTTITDIMSLLSRSVIFLLFFSVLWNLLLLR